MSPPRAVNLMMIFLLPALVCATSLRHKTYPAEDYLLADSSQMGMEDLISNQHAITTTGRGKNSISDAISKSDETPTSSHEAHQVSITSLLRGNYVTAVYEDDKCATVVSAVAYELNTCNYYEGYFLRSAATADTESETRYSDISCTYKSKLSSYIDYTASCVTTSNKQSTLAFVNANGVPPSSLAMASIRLVRIMSVLHAS